MQVIVNGISIETKEIWKIEPLYGNPYWHEAGFRVGLIDKESLEFGKTFPEITNGNEIKSYQEKYDKAMKRLIELWEKDKIETEIILL